jgi:hypothetical protein
MESPKLLWGEPGLLARERKDFVTILTRVTAASNKIEPRELTHSSGGPSRPCTEGKVQLDPDRPGLWLELTIEHEPLVYYSDCWAREFGEEPPRDGGSSSS